MVEGYTPLLMYSPVHQPLPALLSPTCLFADYPSREIPSGAAVKTVASIFNLQFFKWVSSGLNTVTQTVFILCACLAMQFIYYLLWALPFYRKLKKWVHTIFCVQLCIALFCNADQLCMWLYVLSRTVSVDKCHCSNARAPVAQWVRASEKT